MAAHVNSLKVQGVYEREPLSPILFVNVIKAMTKIK